MEDITRESAARLITELSAFKGSRVALSIFSNGGDVHGSQAVAAYISNPANEMQVEARIYGNAASGAMIIAAACQKAYIASGAFALIHKAAAVGPDGKRIPVDELPKEEVAVLDAMNAEQVALFQKRTGKTAASIEKLMDKDRDMPADEAVDLGFFDGIIPQALKLAAYKQIPAMAEDKKTFTIEVKASAALAAIASGKIEVSAEQLKDATDTRIEALEKELGELKAAKELSDKAKTDAEAVTAAKVEELTTASTELKAAKEAVAAYVAKVETLEKTPLKAQALPDGTTVVDPEGDEKKTGPEVSKKAVRAASAKASWDAAFAEKFQTQQA